MYYFI